MNLCMARDSHSLSNKLEDTQITKLITFIIIGLSIIIMIHLQNCKQVRFQSKFCFFLYQNLKIQHIYFQSSENDPFQEPSKVSLSSTGRVQDKRKPVKKTNREVPNKCCTTKQEKEMRREDNNYVVIRRFNMFGKNLQ